MQSFSYYSIAKVFVIVFFIARPVHSEEAKNNSSFYLSESKKLDENELRHKKEGWYPTALPIVSYDPVIGNGFGVIGNLFDNGKKNSPLFEYQPYVYKTSIYLFKSSGRAESYGIDFDSPYLFNTPYRLKLSLSYDRNPNTQYFGIGESTMKPLTYRTKNLSSENLHENAQFSEMEDAYSYRRPSNSPNAPRYVSDVDKNVYDFGSTTLSILLDRTFFGAFRILFSPEFSQNVIRTYDYKTDNPNRQNSNLKKAKDPLTGWESLTPNGKSQLTEDYESKKILGYHGGNINYIRFGLMYDTRDFEPDPDSGVVVELNHAKVGKLTGSDFEFSKTLLQFKYFKMPLPQYFEELVISSRALINYTKGSAPFFEYKYIWSADGPIDGLGGLQTIRGYRQERFVAPVMGVANLEIRWRFATIKKGDELFTFSLVPFFDTGRVWEDPNHIHLKGYARSHGIGLRAIWNQATVVLLDYAKSKEGSQVFLDFNHIF
ncbi:MAG: BamA/TamA family outer membrane protein [Leptospiraceae bacterium]|nr:BamA/TamA family outer membrane protein [Leptospiraceae bacterium]NUM40739.1 BamA/TamA family outer membrane protein [Leptospiraceae bacterium]